MSDSEEGQLRDNSSWERSDGEVTPDSRHSRAATPASELSVASDHRVRSPASSRHYASRSPSRSRSRSRSPSRLRSNRSLSRSMSGSYNHQSYSRSRSRTPPKYERYRSVSPPNRRRRDQVEGGRGNGAWSRSRSRSPGYRPRGGRRGFRRRGGGNGYARGGPAYSRENPEPSRCLGVFGLGLYTQERDLREVFGRYGPIEDIQVVYDRQTRRSRGFGFIYFRRTEDAIDAKEACNGLEVDGRRIRVDFSITDRPHSPTPGVYLGKPTSERYRGQRSSNSPYQPRRGSPSPPYSRHSRSPLHSRRRSHSRSHSWSPRRI